MSDIVDLFAALERAGPGDGESVAWALDLAGLRADAAVLDAGCGTGADLAQLLAAVPQGRVVAVDAAEAFIARVRARFPRVEAHVADMTAPPGGPFDLIWSAGAVYCVGVGAALDAWRGVLAPGGRVAFSDLRWRMADPPKAARDFWAGEGAVVADTAALEAEVAAAGYRVLGARWLDRGAWAAYYEPLEARLDGFAGDAALVAGVRDEIAVWRAHGDSFGYRLLVAELA